MESLDRLHRINTRGIMENKTKVFGCLGLGCGGLIVLIVVIAVGIFMAAASAVKSSDTYMMAMERAESSPAIVEALGKPIEAGFMINGSVNATGPSGHADISIPLSGPKGEGKLFIVGEKSAGLWKFSTLDFEGPSGARVNLLLEKTLTK